MLDRIYRSLLRLLSSRFDAEARREMWDTYRHRIDATDSITFRPGKVSQQVLIELVRQIELEQPSIVPGLI